MTGGTRARPSPTEKRADSLPAACSPFLTHLSLPTQAAEDKGPAALRFPVPQSLIAPNHADLRFRSPKGLTEDVFFLPSADPPPAPPRPCACAGPCRSGTTSSSAGTNCP